MYKKIISVILAFAFLIQSIPPAFAQPISETNTSSPLISTNKESVSELPYIIQEDTSLREEFSKTYIKFLLDVFLVFHEDYNNYNNQAKHRRTTTKKQLRHNFSPSYQY